MKEKVLIIGASTTGKTTLLNSLKTHTSIPILESDDELISLNGGTYPFDSQLKMEKLAPLMVKKVLEMDQVIFLSNTHYFTPQNLEQARQKGFFIIQLQLDREIMHQRSDYRMKHQGYEDHTVYFDDMLNYQKEIADLGLIDKVIDTSLPISEVANEILKILKH